MQKEGRWWGQRSLWDNTEGQKEKNRNWNNLELCLKLGICQGAEERCISLLMEGIIRSSIFGERIGDGFTDYYDAMKKTEASYETFSRNVQL